MTSATTENMATPHIISSGFAFVWVKMSVKVIEIFILCALVGIFARTSTPSSVFDVRHSVWGNGGVVAEPEQRERPVTAASG